MDHHDATNRALKGVRKSVAARLGVSMTLVNRWCSDDETYAVQAPGDRVVVIVETARRNGAEDADAPFLAVAESLGYAVCRMDSVAPAASLIHVIEASRAHAEYLSTFTRVAEDGELSVEESHELLDATHRQIDVLYGHARAISGHIDALTGRRKPARAAGRTIKVRAATA